MTVDRNKPYRITYENAGAYKGETIDWYKFNLGENWERQCEHIEDRNMDLYGYGWGPPYKFLICIPCAKLKGILW